MNVSFIMFCLFLVTKQFYILESGSFQLGDAFLALAVLCFGIWYLIKGRKERGFWEVCWKGDILLAVFVVCAAFINGLWYLKYRDSALLRSSLFLIYNFAAVIVSRYYFREDKMRGIIRLILRANIYIQLLMLLTGIGQYRFEHRWCGTFNDPNQMAFFLLMCLFISFCIKEMEGGHNRNEILDWIVVLVLVVLSKSVGIMAGFGVFGIGYAVYIIRQKLARMKENKEQQKQRKYLLIGIWGGCLLAVALLAGVVVVQYRSGDDYNLLVRIWEKVEILFTGDLKSILADRGLDKILAKPAALLYGAGDGAFDRYGAGYTLLELHCTPAALWFCYGIVPFAIFCMWIWKNIRHLPAVAYIVYAAVFVESLFLVNHRQPYFWMLLVAGMVWREVRERAHEQKISV